MYREYCELTENEKDELRNTMFYASLYNRDDPWYSALSADEQEVIDDCDDESEIPESIMLSAFGGISFVEEDFFCNL
jgi:hypothetical protein